MLMVLTFVACIRQDGMNPNGKIGITPLPELTCMCNYIPPSYMDEIYDGK